MIRPFFDASATLRLDALLQDTVLSLYQAGPDGTQAWPDEPTSARLAHQMRRLLEEGADPRACGTVGMETRLCPFLATAADIGSVFLVRVLLAAGSDPNQASEDTGDAPLHLARTAPIVEALVEAGAHLEQRSLTMDEDEPGGTPLHRALLTGNADVVRALLAAGADPNAGNDDGEPALHAALFVDTDILQALLDAGADPDALDRHDRDSSDRMTESLLSHESQTLRRVLLDAARLSRQMDAPKANTGRCRL